MGRRPSIHRHWQGRYVLVLACLLALVPVTVAGLTHEGATAVDIRVTSHPELIAGGDGSEVQWSVYGYDSDEGYCLNVMIDGRSAAGGCGFGVENGEREIGGLRFASADPSIQLIAGLARAGSTDIRATGGEVALVEAHATARVTTDAAQQLAFVVVLPDAEAGPVVVEATGSDGRKLTSDPYNYPLHQP